MLPFAMGAIVAAILDFVGIELGWQWLAFVVVSTISLFGLRKVSDRMTHEPPERVGVDRVLGKEGVVIEELDAFSSAGRVRIEQEQWRAETADRSTQPVGACVRVERVEGARLIVSAVEHCPEEAPGAPEPPQPS
jgi:membrane protein implicated in regulation of membrane protease activity